MWRRPAARGLAARPPCRHRAARARCPPSPNSALARHAACWPRPNPNPRPLRRPRGCHAGCLREPLRAALARPSFRRAKAVLAQHTTAVKQSAPPRGTCRRGTPRGSPPRPPTAAAHFTLPRVVCCSAQPARQPPREPGASRTRPGAAQPLPPAPNKLVGVPPSWCWSGGAPCATAMKPAQRAPPQKVCAARAVLGSSAPRRITPAAQPPSPAQPSRPPPISCAEMKGSVRAYVQKHLDVREAV